MRSHEPAHALSPSPRFGINPLPWLLTPSGFTLDVATLRTAFAEIAETGFTAVQADIPPGLTPAGYLALLHEYGLTPAPGYFQGAYDNPSAMPALLESARQHAGAQAALGMSEVFIASALTAERIATPAVGAASDPARLDTVIDNLTRTCEVIVAEGLRPCLHPHVGTWIETERETRAVLDAIAPGLLAFGPDTGHLRWAGADPAALITHYRDRVGAAHLKDVHAAVAAQAREAGADFWQTVFERHLWTEPGQGDVDLEAALAALPEDFTGWMVIEVDVPDRRTAKDSAALSRQWTLTHLGKERRR
ncbi:sugar phosphate isomerase/epimerase family protein [Nonomuraea guangzhouensis]|uniref:Sugar phosphate isomerase/epimerase family protein n=1 Tax=Nonomuraea guangzhouensis TaxID=1291555 RepID=A0ABW4G7S1_9ACTN|nr:sugar phosphate isomerase/epimerase [Nonomuraea guangzhouensis]